MPRFDRTGPTGQGPRTGRCLGPCGIRLGRFFGRNTPQTKKEKIKDIQAYKKALEEEIEDVKKEEKNLSGE